MSSLIKSSLFTTEAEDQAAVFYHTRKLFGRKVWYFRRYQDVKFILGNPADFVSDRSKIGMKWLERAYEAYEKGQTSFMGKSLVDYDPPDHSRVRSVVNKALAPDRLKILAHYTQEVVDGLLDDLANKLQGDILAEFAYPVAIRVVIKMLGYPEADIGWLLRVSEVQKMQNIRWKKLLISSRFSRRLRMIYADQSTDPKGGLIAMLVEAEKSELMSHEEALHSLYLLIFGGFETTANFIANAILALLMHPEEMQKLKNGNTITERALDELFRYTNMFRTPRVRWAVAASIVGGVEVNRGDIVVVMLDGANHDPNIFDNANQLNLERSNNQHVAFGHGIHYCLGAPLARLEGKIALESILMRFPKLRLAVRLDELAMVRGWNVNGMKNLPLRWN